MRFDRPRCAEFEVRLTQTVQLAAIHYALATQSVVASYETRTPTPRGAEANTDTSVVTAVDPALSTRLRT